MQFKRSIDTERLLPAKDAAFVHDRSQTADTFGGLTLHLEELVETVRSRFSVPIEFGNEALLADLQDIAREGDSRERWRTAFSSDLGQFLAAGGCDLNTALNTLVALIPRKLS